MQALRAFEAAARERSLSKAATSLHLTHGAISHQIKALEEDLGVRLFERAGRGVRLTDEGERLAARVRTAFGELAAGVQEITERANPRRLRVSVAPSFAVRWLLPRIGRFTSAYPNLDLDIGATFALADLARDDVDFAIRYGMGHWPGVVAEHLSDDSFFPVCSPRIAGGVPKTPRDLSRYALLRVDDEYWAPWFLAAGVDLPEPARGLSFNDSSHLLQAAIEGQGVALARRTLIGNDLRNKVLVKPFDVEVPAPRSFYLAYLPRMSESPKLANLREWLKSEFALDAKYWKTVTSATPGRPRQRGRR
ncbi:MAG TPA: transcriptional regulator GcvA [Casimicrobiaceae bacterium]|nr:transcriptional regulator GcvA [Casimicrobiaceae bacterium]